MKETMNKNKKSLLQIGMIIAMLGIMVYVGITINSMVNDPSYVYYVENIYVPLPTWVPIFSLGVCMLLIFLFAHLSCNGIPYIFWIISFFVDKCDELKNTIKYGGKKGE